MFTHTLNTPNEHHYTIKIHHPLTRIYTHTHLFVMMKGGVGLIYQPTADRTGFVEVCAIFNIVLKLSGRSDPWSREGWER